MRSPLSIAWFGSSLVSAFWNGAVTYYRGLLQALAERGHRITFYEPDAFDRQEHRDIPDPDWARVVVYPGEGVAGVRGALRAARGADLVVKASGVGVFDALLEREVLEAKKDGSLVVFWDVDAAATLERLQNDPSDPFAELVPEYDAVFTYGGGDPVVSAYRAIGARFCAPIYNALDPATHHPVPAEPRFSADLSFLGNRLPDREERVEEFFLRAAALSPGERFLLGGAGWDDKPLPPNVKRAGHLGTRDHNAWNVSARAILNVHRESMARFGWSPATRVFEAAGAGACIITDAFLGVEDFLAPGQEILVAKDGAEVAKLLSELDEGEARRIGESARRRVLAEHTYAHRAEELEKILSGGLTAPALPPPHVTQPREAAL